MLQQLKYLASLCILALGVSISNAQTNPADIYGELFEAVQTQGVFADSKTFPDCIPKYPAHEILESYRMEKEQPDIDLKAFVARNFELPPQYAAGYRTDTQATVTQHIDVLWDVLMREPDEARGGSLIPLPHPYVVPGGRFREVYYWDSYFTMLGLQISGRDTLIQNMVDNFTFLIDRYGFIPNGNRAYYLSRSQPPFYSLMIALLAEINGDSVYAHYLPQLLREYDFWMDTLRSISLRKRKVLNHYWDNDPRPRPESFREDVLTTQSSGRPQAEVYRNIRAACESGWDFSSRWLADGKTLGSIRTTEIIPVDLNALLYHLEITIAKGYHQGNNHEQQKIFQRKALQRKRALQKYCWNKEGGFFYDYNFIMQQETGVLSLAGLYPLFLNMANKKQAHAVAEKVAEKFLFPGGLVTTPNTTREQWDAPNGWAPLQWISIKGLRNYGHDDLAQTAADRWIQLNTKVFSETGKLMEKYHVVATDLPGGGGEYPLQDGFGWTNGVLLKLLQQQLNK